MTEKLSNHFLGMTINAVRQLKQAGINELNIAYLLLEIRAAAISEERSRVANSYPDTGQHGPAVARQLKEILS